MRAADRRRVIHQREDAGADGWLRPPLLFSPLFERFSIRFTLPCPVSVRRVAFFLNSDSTMGNRVKPQPPLVNSSLLRLLS